MCNLISVLLHAPEEPPPPTPAPQAVPYISRQVGVAEVCERGELGDRGGIWNLGAEVDESAGEGEKLQNCGCGCDCDCDCVPVAV